MTLKFYSSVTKRFKLNTRMFWELISKFVKVTGKKLKGEVSALPPLPPPSPTSPPNINRKIKLAFNLINSGHF